jgi:hypothetical protein
MESFTITSRPARVWWIAAGIWLVSAIVVGALVGVQALLHDDRPDVVDWILLPTLPTCLALGWLLFVRITSSQRARQLTAYEWGIAIERFDGRITNLAWKEIRAVDYNSVDEDLLVMQTATERVVVRGEAFSRDDWIEWAGVVEESLAEEVEYRDLQTGFEQRLTRWLNRTSLGFVLVGGIATLALFVWNPNNAAAWIVLFGTLPVLIFLGNQVDVPDDGEIPVAKAIGFFALKMLGILPLCGWAVIELARPAGIKLPAPKNVALFHVGNLMFLGGMACALFVKGGFSPDEYYRDDLRGPNRYARPAFIAAIAVCVVGFAIKAWNER